MGEEKKKINSKLYRDFLESIPEALFLVECWARDGLTNEQICERIGISQPTFYKWYSRIEEFRLALLKGREPVDYLVENALLKRALGYDYVETKVTYGAPDASGNRTKEVTEFKKHIPPETNACLLWLNNRNPDKWRRNNDTFSLMDEVAAAGGNLTINVVKAGEKHIANKRKRNAAKESESGQVQD